MRDIGDDTILAWFVWLVVIACLGAIAWLTLTVPDDSPRGRCLKANPGYHCQSVWVRGAAK